MRSRLIGLGLALTLCLMRSAMAFPTTQAAPLLQGANNPEPSLNLVQFNVQVGGRICHPHSRIVSSQCLGTHREVCVAVTDLRCTTFTRCYAKGHCHLY
jgi:hypothetical protein